MLFHKSYSIYLLVLASCPHAVVSTSANKNLASLRQGGWFGAESLQAALTHGWLIWWSQDKCGLSEKLHCTALLSPNTTWSDSQRPRSGLLTHWVYDCQCSLMEDTGVETFQRSWNIHQWTVKGSWEETTERHSPLDRHVSSAISFLSFLLGYTKN